MFGNKDLDKDFYGSQWQFAEQQAKVESEAKAKSDELKLTERKTKLNSLFQQSRFIESAIFAKLSEVEFNESLPQYACGEGSFSNVYKLNLKNHKQVNAVLKKFIPKGGADIEKRFDREMDVLSECYRSTTYPKNIIKLFYAGTRKFSDTIIFLLDDRYKRLNFEVGPYPYLIMEAGEYGDLSHYIRTYPNNLSWNQCIKFAIDIAAGIDYLHTELYYVHKDIKPGNVIITKNEGAKLIDFSESITIEEYKSPICSGSLGYVAPELFKNGDAKMEFQAYTFKTDIFSYGVTLLYLATKSRSFGAKPEELEKIAQQSSCPMIFKKLILKCISYPAERPNTKEIIETLKPLLDFPITQATEFNIPKTNEMNGSGSKLHSGTIFLRTLGFKNSDGSDVSDILTEDICRLNQ